MNGLKNIAIWIVVLIIVVLVVQYFENQPAAEKLDRADFVAQLQEDNIEKLAVEVKNDNLYKFKAQFKEPVGEAGQKTVEFQDTSLPDSWRADIEEQGGEYLVKEPENGLWQGLLIQILPLMLIIGVFWFFMFRHMQGGSNKAMSFGKSRARLANHSEKVVTFKNVAGVDEAKEELEEIIEFLKDPKRFTRLGGKIPKGVLLVGPPGTGKTLLARAVAGEAHVPFFSISGSDFVEMFVGVGASRVRDLFQQGQKHAPCIIFIDEMDAVGRQRGAGLGGGHDEREQTLNQLLVEMDGFNSSEGVILMAATNRPDVLDRALLRPGRFDRQIIVGNPDITGREQILKIHIDNNNVPIADDLELRTLARGTSGFSGADLANMVNEAALLAARRGQDKVTMIDFEDAKDKVLMGPERRSLVMNPDEKRTTAYHEAGHALMGRILPDADPVHKVTIVPRGPTLGVTSMLPIEDRHNMSRKYCLAQLRMMMGGRAAEDVVFEEFTTGASNDIKRATDIAHAMVCEWGMSDLGPVSFGSNNEVFLGRDFAKERAYSEETGAAVDKCVHQLLEEAYAEAKDTMESNRRILEALAEALIERETLEGNEIDDIIRENGGAHLLPEPEEESDDDVPEQAAASEDAEAQKTKKEKEDEGGAGEVGPSGVVPDTA